MKKFLFLISILISTSSFAQIPAGFYNSATGKTGNTLRTALQTISSSGHVKLPYTSTSFDVWDAYSFTDVLRPGSDTIWDMYSDKPGGTPAYYFTLYTNQCGTAGAEGGCYSREHCMPNSFWGGLDNAANPQYSDLHHLFACDQYVNVQKSNNIIGETTAYTYISSNGSKTGPCSYPGYTDKVFEPIDEYKGDFARAWLYLATRYMNTITTWTPSAGSVAQWPAVYNQSTNTFQPWILNMLLAWNDLDPVSKKEIDRNNAIYYNTPQHNRNPYIDHPEYVCMVWGSNCVVAPTISNISITPTVPTYLDTVMVSANLIDNGSISNAILFWDINATDFSNSISMNAGTLPLFSSSLAIPAQVRGTTVYYKITATDNDGNKTTSETYSYNVPQAEPDNHPTSFTCGTTTSSAISLTWTDAIGTILPNGYLIKMSSVSLASITNPSDGTPVANSATAQNILPNVQTCTFSSLSPSTTYYFKIYSYSNSGSNINYKLIGTIQNTTCNTMASGIYYETCITEGFSGGITAPIGWTFNTINTVYTTAGYFLQTSPSIKFDATGDAITTSSTTDPIELSFWLRGSSTDAISALLIEGYNGTSWVQIDNITNSIPTTGTMKTYNSTSTPALATGFSKFKISYTKSAGNVAFDSLTVLCATNCVVPTIQSSGLIFPSVSSNSMELKWTRGNGNNVIVVAKAGSAVDTDPSSGVQYLDNDVFGSGDQIGTGNYVVYNGPANSVFVSGLSANTTYYYALYEYNNANLCYKTLQLSGSQITDPPIIVPTLTTNVVSSISITTATSGGDITADGGSPVTSRGVCWNTTGSPTIANSKTIDGTGNGAFVSNLTGLSGGITYYVRAYATNANGTSYGTEEVFATLRDEPTNHPTSFTCGTTTTTTIPLSWIGATGTVLPHAYLIKASPIGLMNISDPVDGVPEANSAFVKNVVYGTNTCTFTGLNVNTTYYFKIYSYSNSSSNINYKTGGTIQNTNCATISTPVTIAYQGFEGNAQDTWTYSGGSSNTTNFKYVGTKSRKINSGQTVTFNNISLASYSNVKLSVAYSAKDVAKTENLFLDISYDNGSTWTGTGSVTLVNCNQNSGVRSVAFGATSSTRPTTVSTNPWVVSVPGTSTQIKIRLRCGTLSGNYYIDDIKLSGIQACTYPTAFNVTGGGNYCSGGSGVNIGLSGSTTGIDYQLMLGATTIGSAIAGTGNAISFGLQTLSGAYYVVATNTTTLCATNMNGTANVVADAALPVSVSISANPGITVCPSTSVTFTATPTNGGTTPTYQWKKNGVNVGTNSSTYSTTPNNGDAFVCILTSNLSCISNSPATSNSLSITVSTYPASVSISANPSGTICPSENVTFTAIPTNGGTPSYQWKLNGVNVGTNSATYSSNTLSNGNNVTCVMTSSLSCATGSPATSNSVSMSVNSTTAVSVSLAVSPSNSITSGDQVTFTATPTNGGTTPSYIWKKNGLVISGETSATYTTSSLTNGDIVNCELTSNVTCPSNSPAISNLVTMTVAIACTGGTTATVFSDDFSTNSNAAYTSTGAIGSSLWNVTRLADDWGARRNTSPLQLELTNDISATANANGWIYSSTNLSSFSYPFNSTLNANPGLITWTFNMKSNRTSALAGFTTTSSYGLAFIVASTSNTPNTTGTGYAVVMGGGGTNTVALIKFNNGLQGTKTVVIAYAGAPVALTNYMSLKLTYNPNTNLWELHNRDDGNTAFADPTTGTLNLLGSGSDNTYTSTIMNYMGAYWQGSTAATQSAFIDNVKVTVENDPYPKLYSVSGGGSYCNGGTGVDVSLSNSQIGMNYQLKVNGSNSGSPVAGTGTTLSFGNQTLAGSYTVVATNTTTNCSATMTGSTNVSINSLPIAQNIAGGGSYCNGSSGISIGLDNSETGVNYQMKLNGTDFGSLVAGTNSIISFGNQTSTGNYTILATNSTTSCSSTMNGTASVNLFPDNTIYNVTGSGSYCSGGAGVLVGLDNSEIGTTYQLKLNGSNVGISISGTGNAISFGNQTSPGTYTVLATNDINLCSTLMNGNAVVSINSLATTYSVTGGGAFCNGGSGVAIGLSNSQTGVNYQLKLNGSDWGSVVVGTGSLINFGIYTISGTYTVDATISATSCVNSMSGNAIVSSNPNPTAYLVTGGGTFCNGGTGVIVGLNNTEVGVNYQLKKDGSNTGSPFAGNGTALNFGLQSLVGTYTISASNATTSCVNNMTGNVSISTNSTPIIYNVTGGGSYCNGGSGVEIGLSNSELGVDYQLQIGGVNTGTSVSGTGTAISFGSKTDVGNYSVIATNSITLCSISMSGTVSVSINSLQPTTTISTTPSCGVGTVSLTSNQTGNQIFELCDNLGSTLQSWTGNATNHSFTSISDGIYTGKITFGGCPSNLSSPDTLTNTLQALASITAIPGCGSGTITISSNQSGIQTFDLCNSSGGVLQTWTGNATSRNFTSLSNAVYYGRVTLGSCPSNLTIGANLTNNSYPTVYSVSGGGSFCDGETGVSINLSNSQIGVEYWTKINAIDNGTPISGNGSAISFGNQIIEGTYTIRAKNTTSLCEINMSGNALATKKVLPIAQIVQVDQVLSSVNTATSYQWLDCDNGNSPILDEIYQDFFIPGSGNFAVKLTTNSCSATSDCYYVATTNIKNSKLNDFISVYPNPTSKILNVKFENLNSDTKINILDVTGKSIVEREISAKTSISEFDLSKLPKGIYLVKVLNNEKVKIEKIVVE